MAKQANAGELRTLVYFRKVIKETDEEGRARVREEGVFYDSAGREVPVHCGNADHALLAAHPAQDAGVQGPGPGALRGR